MASSNSDKPYYARKLRKVLKPDNRKKYSQHTAPSFCASYPHLDPFHVVYWHVSTIYAILRLRIICMHRHFTFNYAIIIIFKSMGNIFKCMQCSKKPFHYSATILQFLN